MNQEPKYLVQLLERTEHFCKMFKLVTLAKLPEWVEEAQAVADVCSKRNPTHSYVMYISNNPVDLAKGEKKLIQQEAIKVIKGEQSKIGITTSTKAMYLGMSREIVTFDFDTKTKVKDLQTDVIHNLHQHYFNTSYTLTPNGIHVHLHAKHKAVYEVSLPNHLNCLLDKAGHDTCSPIAGTYKDGFLIQKGHMYEPN